MNALKNGSALRQFGVYVKSTAPAGPNSQADEQVTDQVQNGRQEIATTDKRGVAKAMQAQIKNRLAALAGRYKEAVAANGPDAQRMRDLFTGLRTATEKRQYGEAAKALGTLEQLLDQNPKSPTLDLRGLDTSHDHAFGEGIRGDDAKDAEPLGIVASGPQASPATSNLPLPGHRGLTAINISTNGLPLVVAPGGRLYLFAMGVFDQGPTEQLRGDLVTWNTDDRSSVTVDSKGIATGVSYGTAKITATEKSSGFTSPAITISVEDATSAGDKTPKDKLPPELVKIYDQAKFDYQTLLVKAQQLDHARKELPPEKEIFEEIARSTSQKTTDAADNLRMKKELAQEVLGHINDLKTWMEFFKKQQQPVFEKIHAEELRQEAAELREKAEELKSATEAVFKFLEDGLSLGTKIAAAAIAPEFEIIQAVELIEAGIHTAGDMAQGFHKSIQQMLEKAKQDEKQAHELQLKALKEEAQNLENARKQAEKNMAPTLERFSKVANEARIKAKNVEKAYDGGAKGKFRFSLLQKPLEMAATMVKTLVPQARKSAMDAYGVINQFERSYKRSLAPMKKDTLSWTREAGVIGESAKDALQDLAELQDTAHEAMASAHDYDK
jgi:hypothetical protein